MRPFCALLAAALVAPAALPQPDKADPAATPPPLDAGATVYQKVVRSTVWVHSDRGGGRLATGSGSLIDKSRRLVLTNYHVVGDVRAATVFFPAFTGTKTVPEKKFYTDRAAKLGIRGEVVEIDKGADLALVRIDRVPDGVPELALAPDGPDPGQAVHSIGNPGKSGALWVYTPGKVRQTYSKKWQAKLDERTTVTFQAKVIETDSPTNPGDSGGPLVNDKAQLVGVTQGGAIGADSISIFVDLSEVKRLMNRRSVQLLRAVADSGDPPKAEPKKPARDAALPSKDDGKFFGEAAWKKVAPAADKLLKAKGVDLVIETYATPPKGDAEKLKALPGPERNRFFEQLAKERTKELKAHGVYVIASKTPASLYVLVDGSAGFPAEFGDRVRSTLISNFTNKKFDEGLEKVLALALEAQGVGDKK